MLTVINICGLPTSPIDSQPEMKGKSVGKQSVSHTKNKVSKLILNVN